MQVVRRPGPVRPCESARGANGGGLPSRAGEEFANPRPMAAPRPLHPPPADPPWRAQELLLMSEVMRLVGQSLAPEVVLREMLHLLSELLGLNRGRVVLADGVL